MEEKMKLEIMKKSLKLTDLYMMYNFDDLGDLEDLDEEPKVGYFLSTKLERDGCSTFLVGFNSLANETMLAQIEIICSYIEYGLNLENKKFNLKKNDDFYIGFVISGTNGDSFIDYNEEDVKFIIPLNEILI